MSEAEGGPQYPHIAPSVTCACQGPCEGFQDLLDLAALPPSLSNSITVSSASLPLSYCPTWNLQKEKKKEHFDYTISKHQKPRVPSESRCLFNEAS